jgi:homoserine O-acetyltransferase
MNAPHTFENKGVFALESGETLHDVRIAYHTFGTFSPDAKVVWVCHALTANSDVSDWWKGLFGENDLFRSSAYFVVCANVLGSCYGTTGPLSNTENACESFLNFPPVTTRDMANAHVLLKNHLKIDAIEVLIGSSLGGQQAQEFAYILQDQLKNLILIATNAQHSPFGIAFNEAQRLALLADPSFEANKCYGGQKGLKAARSIAMLSYRSYSGYGATQQEESNETTDNFRAASYQNYQGQKLVNRFNAYSYWFLGKAMDSHNIGRMRGSIGVALATITAKTLVVGITSDLLFPISEQKYLADHIPNAQLVVMDSIFGHDGFLVETKELEQIITNFLNK